MGCIFVVIAFVCVRVHPHACVHRAHASMFDTLAPACLLAHTLLHAVLVCVYVRMVRTRFHPCMHRQLPAMHASPPPSTSLARLEHHAYGTAPACACCAQYGDGGRRRYQPE
ncbi:hypothetical protein EON66_02275 [archaeon]|nr:MAG: hypothetical protein EON66_02275 [archaeon]